MNDLIKSLGLGTEALVIAAILAYLWNSFSKITEKKGQEASSVLETLYSPAYALLLNKGQRQQDEKEFIKQFTELLQKNRHKATKKIRANMDNWLSGTDNETELIDLLKNECEDEKKWKEFGYAKETFEKILASAIGTLLSGVLLSLVVALFFVIMFAAASILKSYSVF